MWKVITSFLSNCQQNDFLSLQFSRVGLTLVAGRFEVWAFKSITNFVFSWSEHTKEVNLPEIDCYFSIVKLSGLYRRKKDSVSFLATWILTEWDQFQVLRVKKEVRLCGTVSIFFYENPVERLWTTWQTRLRSCVCKQKVLPHHLYSYCLAGREGWHQPLQGWSLLLGNVYFIVILKMSHSRNTR